MVTNVYITGLYIYFTVHFMYIFKTIDKHFCKTCIKEKFKHSLCTQCRLDKWKKSGYFLEYNNKDTYQLSMINDLFLGIDIYCIVYIKGKQIYSGNH
jgi:hypothetical protein